MNPDVDSFLKQQNHPLQALIDELRSIIGESDYRISENIKWNGPNYHVADEDRITMKIFPPKQIQLIFHRGVKKLQQPDQKLIEDNSGLLVWKENDRAVMTLKNLEDCLAQKADIQRVIVKWLDATL